MDCIFKNGHLFKTGEFVKDSLGVFGGSVVCCDHLSSSVSVLNCGSLAFLPGFADVHVHLREPGFLYKETVKTGTSAAAHGGYTTVCAMPNLSPAPDCLESLSVQLDAIKRDAVMQVIPYGTITVGENGGQLSDMEALAPFVAGFSDDGRGVQDEDMMRAAMVRAKKLGKLIVAHCEDNTLLRGGYIHDGQYAHAHSHSGICSESEWGPIKRDLRLAAETDCSYHVCHISTKESVQLIREAKKAGIDVTCETAPHYLVMNDSMLQEDGRFKMNPPIRSAADQQALLEGICDGTIDMIATDHAPHSAEEKSKGLKDSLMGVVGLETAFPVLYTFLVKKGIISMARLVELMCTSPRKRFSLNALTLEPTSPASFSVWDLESSYAVDPSEFVSMGKATPFAGWEVQGRCLLTVCNGRIAWSDGTLEISDNSLPQDILHG